MTDAIATPEQHSLDQAAVEQFNTDHMPEVNEDGEPWSYEQCNDDQAAEQHLKCIRYWQKKAAEFDAHADAEIERVNAWRESRKKSPEWQQQFHLRCLENWFKDDERKTARLINGTVKKFSGRERIEITDEEQIPQAFLRATTTYSPDKKHIISHIRSTGDIPNGCDLVRGEDSVKVEVNNG